MFSHLLVSVGIVTYIKNYSIFSKVFRIFISSTQLPDCNK